MDSVRELIVEKLGERRISMADASKTIGKNHAYLQQFIYRGVPISLPEEVRGKLADLLGVPESALRGASAPFIGNKGKRPASGANGNLTAVGTLPDHGPVEMLRVLGMAEGGPDGWNLFNGEIIQFIRRPDNLIGVPGAYAVYVNGTSMEPRYHAGEIAHIHPGRPVMPGCYVLVQKKAKADGEPPLAVIKRLVRRSGSKIVLAQHSPPKEFEIRVDEVVSMHRVVGSSEA